MNNPFDRLLAIADRTLDSSMLAERFRVTPMRRRRNGRSDLDPDRRIVIARGIFERRTEDPSIEFGARRGGNDLGNAPVRRTPVLSIASSALGGQDVRQGDHVDMLDREESFEVASVRPDGHGRIEILLA